MKPTIASQSWVFAFCMRLNFNLKLLKNNMRTRNKLFKPRFGPETGFEVGLIAPVPHSGPAENDLEQLKTRLLSPLLTAPEEAELNTALRRAANDAASAAWFTPFPLLFFPTLLEEKAASARRQVKRQQEVRKRSQGLLEQAISE